MSKAKEILSLWEESQNKSKGFYGTVKSNFDLGNTQVEIAWKHMVKAFAAASGGENQEVEMYLDSASGRHIADDLTKLTQEQESVEAVKKAIDQWIKSNPKWATKEFKKWKEEGVFADPDLFYQDIR